MALRLRSFSNQRLVTLFLLCNFLFYSTSCAPHLRCICTGSSLRYHVEEWLVISETWDWGFTFYAQKQSDVGVEQHPVHICIYSWSKFAVSQLMAQSVFTSFTLIKLDSVGARTKPVWSQYYWLLHLSQQTYWLDAGSTLDSRLRNTGFSFQGSNSVGQLVISQ